MSDASSINDSSHSTDYSDYEPVCVTMEWMFKEAATTFDKEVYRTAIMCDIYDAFVAGDESKHNCLGCNLQEAAEQISWYLNRVTQVASPDHPDFVVTLYVFILNSLWERMTDICEIIGLPDSYRSQHFEPLIRARRWANFFKHPKEFAWLVHHPEYVIENTDSYCKAIDTKENALYINDDFLKDHYSCDRKKGLKKKLKDSRDNVVVVLPDVAQLTTGVCDSIKKFVSLLSDNPVYKEILDDDCSVAGYFDRECEAATAATPKKA